MMTSTCRSAAIEELADVVICVLSFANRTGIDIAKAAKQKVEKNAKKYPVASIRGQF
jgi:NTP pyrophosphatase (non-canonical NTP hydrolase)